MRTRRPLGLNLAWAMLALMACQATPPASAEHPFDGSWAVTVSCPTAADGALAYIYRFGGEVRGGVLTAQNGREGTPGYLQLRGAIRPDGTGTLAAEGVTGQAEYVVGGVGTMRRYTYTVPVRFEGAAGNGRRTEARICDLNFRRQ